MAVLPYPGACKRHQPAPSLRWCLAGEVPPSLLIKVPLGSILHARYFTIYWPKYTPCFKSPNPAIILQHPPSTVGVHTESKMDGSSEYHSTIAVPLTPYHSPILQAEAHRANSSILTTPCAPPLPPSPPASAMPPNKPAACVSAHKTKETNADSMRRKSAENRVDGITGVACVKRVVFRGPGPAGGGSPQARAQCRVGGAYVRVFLPRP